MNEIKIILPDNSVKTFDHEPTTLEVANSIGARLAKDTLGAKLNGSKETSFFSFENALKYAYGNEVMKIEKMCETRTPDPWDRASFNPSRTHRQHGPRQCARSMYDRLSEL